MVAPCCAAPSVAARLASYTTTDEPGVLKSTQRRFSAPKMIHIPGGEFRMGSVDELARFDERPMHMVRVDPFLISETEITNAQFARFIDETGYVTTAERPVDWEELKKQVPPGTPKPPDEVLAPGSLVFMPPEGDVNDPAANLSWWQWTHGADWRHPEGPDSNITDRMDHPVVHVSFEDAKAYCEWFGARLPTEAEWEFAARGGLINTINPWGNEPISPKHANTWQGTFPRQNTADDGFVRTAPVKTFAHNDYGLYDVAGNVWEWTTDLYRIDAYAQRVEAIQVDTVIENPTGPETVNDPRNPNAPDSRVQRGGSFLCHDSYCASYRVSARMGCTPDTSMSHVGFRIVRDAAPQQENTP